MSLIKWTDGAARRAPSLYHTHTLPGQPHGHPRCEARHTPRGPRGELCLLDSQAWSSSAWLPRGGLQGVSLCPRMGGEHWSPKQPTVMAMVPHLFPAFWNGPVRKHATGGKTQRPMGPVLTSRISPDSVRPAGTASPRVGSLHDFHTERPANEFEDVFKIQTKEQVLDPPPFQFSPLALRGKAGQP